MEGDPFAVIESLAIAALAVGARRGYLYVRGEYPDAERLLRGALHQAQDAGRLDLPAGPLEIDIRRGGGAYICGEETALFNSIEGFRGEPRNKPPYPTESGLFGKPTVVNNVETLVNVPHILAGGAFEETKLFCVSGDIVHAGTYEVPMGTPLGDLIDAAGGIEGELQAILLGGAAGSFVGGELLDLRLSFEATREAGVSLGSGVVMILNSAADLTDLMIRTAQFFRDESCGQCVPCRVGTVRQHEALKRGGAERGTVRRSRRGDGRRVHLRSRSHCLGGPAIGPRSGSARRGEKAVSERVELTIDGDTVSAPSGATILQACRELGLGIPTICQLDTLTPANACRVCVVEVEGSRPLVPSCSRQVAPDMVIQTESERVRAARRMVVELLASSVDLDRAEPGLAALVDELGASPERHRGDGTAPPAQVEEPVRRQDDLYVRDYSRCVLCYKCVEACGDDAQHTFAIAVSGRGFESGSLPSSTCRCPNRRASTAANCVDVCPTGALVFTPRVRPEGYQRVGSLRPGGHDVGLSLLRGGLQPGATRTRGRDRRGHLTPGPLRDQRAPVRQRPLRLPVRRFQGPTSRPVGLPQCRARK